MSKKKLNINESLKILEQSGVLNPDMKMKSIMNASKKMEDMAGVPGDLEKLGWSVLIYTNFILAAGMPDEELVVKDPRITTPSIDPKINRPILDPRINKDDLKK